MTNERLEELQGMKDKIDSIEAILLDVKTSGYETLKLVGGYHGDSTTDYIMDIDTDLRQKIIQYLEKRLAELKTKFKEA